MENTENESVIGGHKITSLDIPDDGAGISSSLRCHPGAVREENQDCVGHSVTPLGELFLVLDGVGGRSGGATASILGLKEYVRFVSEAPSESDPVEVLQQATQSVTQRLEDARQTGPPELQEMASTVALVLLHDTTAYVGHIGDSRVYRMRGNTCTLLTRDHSVVQRMIAEGLLTAEQAQSHPSSHILTHSLGQSDAAIEVAAYEVETGDIMLICSDGLWGYVEVSAIEAVLGTPELSAAGMADALLQSALAGEAGDNISIVVIRIADISRAPPKKLTHAIKRFARRHLYVLLTITVLLVGAALYLIIWGPWVL